MTIRQSFSVLLTATGLLITAVYAPAQDAELDHHLTAPLPSFSWDTVPRFAHLGKETFYTDEEIVRLAEFPVVVLEKGTGSREAPFNSEAHQIREFERIKTVNPSTFCIFYVNALIERYHYAAGKIFLQQPGWLLRDREGVPVLRIQRNPQYDLSNPGVRDWWLTMVEPAAQSPVVNGIFVDAVPQIERRPDQKRAEWGDAKYEGMLAGARDILSRSLQLLGPNRHLIFNGIFIMDDWWDHDGLAWNDYSTGMMVEFFARTHRGVYDPDRVSREIEIIRELAAQRKLVLVKGWPASRTLHFQRPEHHDIPPEERLQILRDTITFPLAAFLIAVEEGVYFGYSYGWKHDMGWLADIPEFDRPLGPPEGPPAREGNVWQREFRYASVWLDADAREARIDWRAVNDE